MTKSEMQELLLTMAEPLKTHYTEGKAGLYLGAEAAGYGIRIANMEGFARVLWGLTPFWAGGGREEDFLNIYRTGLTNGTNPLHPEYWGELKDKDQRMVEMAAISYSILMVPELIWGTLSEEAKDNLASWLNQINSYSQADNNWQFFNVITNLALKSIGKPYSRERMQYAMDRYEAFYLGNGWYADGLRPQKDYYISFGIHYYCLLYSVFMGKEDPGRARLYKDRAAEFAESFLYWFDDEGRALPYGRSLTYRFAQAAFWSAYVLAGAGSDSLSLGIIKGIIVRHLRYWMEQPIFDNGGVLSVGYCYPNLTMSEGYNAPGSPYWSFKIFACLALPDDHPFWQAKEEPLPELKPIRSIPECNMMMQHRRGEVTALTAGQYPLIYQTHAAEKYAKFAYSSRFGFSVPRSSITLEECAPDSMVAFHVHDMYYVRKRCLDYRIEDDRVYSKWSPIEGITVETILIPTGEGHIRRHRIVSEIECKAYDCGFSYPWTAQMEAESACGFARVGDGNGCSFLHSDTGNGRVIHSAPNTNLIYPLTAIPAIEYTIGIGFQMIETEVSTDFKPGDIVIGSGDCYWQKS